VGKGPLPGRRYTKGLHHLLGTQRNYFFSESLNKKPRRRKLKTYKPTRKNLPPKIVEHFEKNREWHLKNGHGPVSETDELLKQFTAWENEAFIILLQGGGKKYNGNCAIRVFNKKGVFIDARIYYHPGKKGRAPKKAFIGVPIINGTKPLQLKPPRKKDSPFVNR
jgi:hypothetical protein